MTDLIFLDTETTGLNPEIHEVWEIATAKNDGKVIDFFLSHTLRGADPKALELSGYYERMKYGDILPVDQELAVRESMRDQTIVVANPTFDRMMLRERWRLEPWHYRSIDIETMAMTVFGWDRPRGMKDIRDHLVRMGRDVISPDHTAKVDVECLRQSYWILREIQQWQISSWADFQAREL